MSSFPLRCPRRRGRRLYGCVPLGCGRRCRRPRCCHLRRRRRRRRGDHRLCREGVICLLSREINEGIYHWRKKEETEESLARVRKAS